VRNEFFGDIRDYRKYGLLRILCGGKKASAAVCWMLRPDKGEPKPTRYLLRPETWRHFDARLFDALRQAAVVEGERNVARAEHPDVLDPAVFSFYKADFRSEFTERRDYLRGFLASAEGRELVFFDPDIGLEPRGAAAKRRRSVQHLYFDELASAFDSGHSILVFQFFMAIAAERVTSEKAYEVFSRLGAVEIASFKTDKVIFFLIPQPQHVRQMKERSVQVRSTWGKQIQPEWHSRTRGGRAEPR
jgi:hypothetical protein